MPLFAKQPPVNGAAGAPPPPPPPPPAAASTQPQTEHERPAIRVVDTNTSLRQAIAEQQRAEAAGIDMRARARERYALRIAPERSGISLSELNEGGPAVRARAEQIAREVVRELQDEGLNGRGPLLDDAQAEAIVRYLLDYQFGMGPLEPLFGENDVEDVVVNSRMGEDGKPYCEVWTYRQSGKRREDMEVDPYELLAVINRHASEQGRALNPSSPILNARLKNGSRINAILDPVCDPAIAVTIRRHRLVARSFSDLVRLGSLSEAAADFLWLATRARLAMIVAGGTGSGKTNMLNAIARTADPDERVVVIEDTRELELAVKDVVYMVTVQGDRPITQRHLVANALRMRPDRIVLGEVRGGEAWDAVKAANTGHDGTLVTVHAEDAEGAIGRFLQLCREAEETAQMPERTVLEFVASAFQLVVFLARRRMPDGSYKRGVLEIVESPGHVREGRPVLNPIFVLRDGKLTWTNYRLHERVREKIINAGFSEAEIEAALQGKLGKWREA
jgi:pilus assembly protein CpaF